MLIAMNVENEQITADKDLTKSEVYYCPSCQSPVHLKAGTVMRAHFAHYQNDACDVFSEGETEEHINGKQQLKEWLEAQNIPVEMEAYLPQLKQRPDLLIEIDRQKIALEFQCSPISIAKVTERTNGYLKAGYQVIWILGDHFNYTKQLTAFQKACLTHLEDQLVLFHYSVRKKRLTYRFNFHIKQNQKMGQTKKVLHKAHLQFDKKRLSTNTPIPFELEHNKLLRQLQFPTAKSKRFLETLYERNETLVSMPKELYTMMPSEWMLQNHSYEWKLQFLLALESLPRNSILTQKKLKKWTSNLTYYEIPQLTEEQKLKPIRSFIEVLVQSNVLKQTRFDKWTVINPAKRYNYLEDKFK